MAVTETRILPPEFIEAAGKTYLGDLATATGQFKTADLSKTFGPQFVAGQESYLQRGFGDLLSLVQKGMSSGGDIDMSQNPYDWGSYLKNPYMRLKFPTN